MVKPKIKSKIPNNKIKFKKPSEPTFQTIKTKTPEDSNNLFQLPPPRENKNSFIPKDEVKTPTRLGLREENSGKKSLSSNVYPPRILESKDYSKTHLPSNKGVFNSKKQRKPPLNQPLPKKISKTIVQKIPKSYGGTIKKKEDSMNRPLPKITIKSPPKHVIKDPPPTKEKIKNKAPPKMKIKTPSSYGAKNPAKINISPPKSIKSKTPNKKKKELPSTLETKIPKIKIISKKPSD